MYRNNAADQAQFDNLVAAGVPEEVVKEAKAAGFDWKTILTYLIKFGVEGLGELAKQKTVAVKAVSEEKR